ncbi:MAG: methyltransferase domain-containing protein [Bauldia sp.]
MKRFVAWNRSGARWLERVLPRLFGSPSYKDELEERVWADIGKRAAGVVMEVGGIDRPLLRKGAGFAYIGLDIEEKPQCYDVYDRFVVQSVEDPIPLSADLILSITLLEHVPDNRAAIHSIHQALSPGGTTHHYVPSKWHPYSIATRVVGPTLQKQLIRWLRPEAEAVTGYLAFYDHCSPGAMIQLFRRAGFVDIDVKPFYRASDYFAFFLPAYIVIALAEDLAALLRARIFASGFVISASKSP